MRANLKLHVTQLRFLRLNLVLIRFDLEVFNLRHHCVERLVHLIEFAYVRLALSLRPQIAGTDMLHNTAQPLYRLRDGVRQPPLNDRNQHQRQQREYKQRRLQAIERAEIPAFVYGKDCPAIRTRQITAHDHIPLLSARNKVALIVAVQIDPVILHKIDRGQRLVIFIGKQHHRVGVNLRVAHVRQRRQRHHRHKVRAAPAVKTE